MRRYWWTVWIKVAVVAAVLFVGYHFASNKIEELISPYILDEPEVSVSTLSEEPETTVLPNASEPPEEGINKKNLLTTVLNKFQDVIGVRLDFENLIFDYANEYAQQMKEESDAARRPVAGT